MHTVPAAEDGQRLDRYLKNAFPALPFAAVQKLLRTGQVRVNGGRAKPETRLQGGDTLRLPPSLHMQAENPAPSTRKHKNYQLTQADRQLIKAATIFEDEHLLVLNKPAGLAAQAGSGVTRSLDRILAALYPDGAPKLAHRLDRDTTGLIVLGKTRAAAAHLIGQFQQHAVHKVYLALLSGTLPGQPDATDGHIREPLRKKEIDGGARVIISADGDPAHTSWQLHAQLEAPLQLVTATPHTGRMNQLRAHFAHAGAPVVGDAKYGGPPARRQSQTLHAAAPLFLHAWQLRFVHPATGQPLSLTAPLPGHFQAIMAA